MSTIRPLDDRILVKPHPPTKETPGGLIIPDVMAYDAETVGEVIAVGEGPLSAKGVRYEHLVHVGDRVLFSNTVGYDVRDAYGEPLLVMRETDVLAVFED